MNSNPLQMHYSFRLITLLWIVPLLFTGCSERYFDCERGSKDIVSETRDVDSFKAISISNSFHVEITQGEDLIVRVEAEDNIIDQVVTHVEGSTLVIKKASNSCFSERKTIRVFITTPELEAISLSGSGKVEVNSLTTDYLNLLLTGSGDMDVAADATDLEVEITGSGKISMVGEGDESKIEVTGSGDFSGFSFAHNRCFATITGSGSVRVNVSDLLDVEITGSGDVIYRGNPSVRTDITGSGDVKRF